MLLGLQDRFVPFVEEGSKTHSIRAMRKRPFRVGDRIDAYANVRQKTMRLLGRWPCVRVEDILIYHSGCGRVQVVIARLELTPNEKDLLAWRDGFRTCGTEAKPRGCFDEMVEFWIKAHGKRFHHYAPVSLDFSGQIVHWKWQPPVNDATNLPQSKSRNPSLEKRVK